MQKRLFKEMIGLVIEDVRGAGIESLLKRAITRMGLEGRLEEQQEDEDADPGQSSDSE